MIPGRIALISKIVIKRIAWFMKSSRILSGFSVLCMYLPRNMGDGNIRLRPPRFRDRHVIGDGLRNEAVLSPRGRTGLISKSYISVWWLLRQTYTVLYCIEADSVCIGFIGIYNLQPDRSAELSLMIFDRKNRRLGYGTKAFNLLEQNLDRYHIKLNVRIAPENTASLSFCKKLGFEEHGDIRKIKVMSQVYRKVYETDI
jgi:RimJ/RimL family protein N-acetyltransferase